ncbi:cysteine hydrolase family protein [Compostimonas suwonensis]|uniref:Nicotinamidase-related amidase n=1 Tax=Compostimonas suwonensis TaxID=1048394 RepID=A0A2M9C0D0_9MICO|nr:isochorismatase family cysteine hydrolase [Compostimonas suwonensis]PJJ63774.1 nicotinamidase-related amidase [Compostimonas suwonensis]
MTSLRQDQLAQLVVPDRTPALVVVDVQRDFGDPERLGAYGLDDDALTELDRTVTRIGELVDAARRIGVPVVWVELGSDPAHPWKASNWLREGDYDAPMGDSEPCVIGTPGAEWYRMEPAAGELRVVKRGYSGFLGTRLDEQLRAAGYGWLTIVGLTSECCVDATAQDAMQLDWPVVVPRDATAAYDLAVNEAALAQLELNVAVLSDAHEVIGLWERAIR